MPPRQVKQKQKQAQVEFTDSDGSSDASEAEYYAPSRAKGGKKAKKSQTVNAGKAKKQGKLEVFLALPIDVFSEICDNLTLKDMLALAVTSKNLRAIVTSGAFRAVWMTLRRSLGLPDLSEAMKLNEVQYAHLVTVNKCFECGTNCLVADYTLRRRLCKACKRKLLVTVSPKWHPKTRSCIAPTFYAPKSLSTAKTTPYLVLSDGDFISQHLFSLETQDREENKATKENGAAQPRLSLVQQYVADRSADVVKIQEDAEKVRRATNLIDWDRYYANQVKKEDIADVKHQRAYDIINRIDCSDMCDEDPDVEYGVTLRDFRYSILRSNTYKSSPIVNKALKLTDAEWQKIEPAILKLVEQIKAEFGHAEHLRLDRIRQSKLRSGYTALFEGISGDKMAATLFPRFADFVYLPTPQTFWEDPEAGFNQTRWSESLPQIQEEIVDYQAAVRVQAVKTILAATTKTPYKKLKDDDALYGPDRYDDAFLRLATSSMFCTLGCSTKTKTNQPTGDYNVAKPALCAHYFDLLSHQHSVHSVKLSNALTHGHFELPAAASVAIRGMLKTRNANPGSATIIAFGTDYFRWTNGPKHWQKMTRWRELLEEIRFRAVSSKGLVDPTISANWK